MSSDVLSKRDESEQNILEVRWFWICRRFKDCLTYDNDVLTKNKNQSQASIVLSKTFLYRSDPIELAYIFLFVPR